jgi:hypothetical protein
MDLSKAIDFLTTAGPTILGAVLTALGGLKVIARYTPFEWDDKILDAAEKPFQYLSSLLGKK